MLELKSILRANAASCIIFGALFAIFPKEVATFVGTIPSLLVLIVGILLIGNGVLLILAASKSTPVLNDILLFSVGDFIWVLITAGLIVTETWITTQNGKVVAIAIAVMVGLFGVMQFIHYKRNKQVIEN